jgi:hypothetical protein
MGPRSRQYVIATVDEGPIGHNFYTHIGTLNSGERAGEKCYIAYLGDPSKIENQVLVRTNPPLSSDPNFSLNDSIHTSSFITSKFPEGFVSLENREVLLEGILTEEQIRSDRVPSFDYFISLFDPGPTGFFVYLGQQGDSVVAYEVSSAFRTSLMRNGDKPRTVRGALARHLRQMDKERRQWDSRFVGIAEGVSSNEMVVRALVDIVADPELPVTTIIEMEAPRF